MPTGEQSPGTELAHDYDYFDYPKSRIKPHIVCHHACDEIFQPIFLT